MDYCLEYDLLLDDNHVYKEISYQELIDLFDTLNTGLVFIGGPWCKNCQAVIARVNSLAKLHNLDCIYNYNPKFMNVFNELTDLRDCKTLENKLDYYYIVERLGFKSEELVADTLIPKMHVPFFFAIKNGSCTGYYSEELLMDKYLHKENDDTDLTKEFDENIIKLIKSIEE